MSAEVSSSTLKNLTFVGIVNVTPDSFSDGCLVQTLENQVAHVKALIAGGASMIDIGGDSTRPGSVCVGADTEWSRIEPLVRTISGQIRVSVDTHHPEVARRSLKSGAVMINDISGGSDEMFRVIAEHKAQVVIMYSRCSRPHVFDLPRPKDLIISIKNFFDSRAAQAKKCGLSMDQLLFDPGMGAFLSDVPRDSFELIRNIEQLINYSPLYIGISRKGFLSALSNESASERDAVSSMVSMILFQRMKNCKRIYFRTHRVDLLREFLSLLQLK